MAGTINTTNYGFKKYAPNDTVSTLQTFNGNMDAIDSAIKSRENTETEQSASITKLENGLASTNDGLNSANQTISAVQVQVTTNTRNISNNTTEIDALDARVQALEDGGSAISTIQLNTAAQPVRKYASLYKQGNHVFGTFLTTYSAISASDTVTISACDNYNMPSAETYLKIFTLTGNLFGLNPNIGHVIGVGSARFTLSNVAQSNSIVCVALFDGVSTYLCALGDTTLTSIAYSLSIDSVI